MEVALTPKERIQNLALYFNVSLRALAKAVGMSEATMYHITDTTLTITPRTAVKIHYNVERRFGVVLSMKWLTEGTGEMIVSKGSRLSTGPVEELPAEPTGETGYENEWQERYYRLLEKYTELQDRCLSLAAAANGSVI